MYVVRHYEPRFTNELARLIVRYSTSSPDAKVLPAEFYSHHPALDDGRNVLCAFDDAGNLQAFAPLFPVPVKEGTDPEIPNHIWTVITVDPGVEDKQRVRDLLFDRVYDRALEIRETFGDRKTRLGSDLFDSQREEIEYFLSKGFVHYESLFLMARDCAEPLPDLRIPTDITVRRWKMRTLEGQQMYINAHDSVFDKSPMTLEGLQCFLKSAEGMFI